MKTLFTFIALFCSCLGGYAWELKSKVETMDQLAADLSTGDSGVPSRSLSYAISVLADENARVGEGSHSGRALGSEAVVSALDHVNLTSHEEELWKAIGDDRIGLNFRRILVVSNHAGELPGSDFYLRDFYQGIHDDPQSWMADIHEILSRIPLDGFPLERAALLTIMGQSVKNNEQVKAQALNELVGHSTPARPDPRLAQTEEELNLALSTTPHTVLPLIAQNVFLNQTTDSGEALSGTIQGIVAQSDIGIRFSLAAQFTDMYPQMKGELMTALESEGISLTLGGS